MNPSYNTTTTTTTGVKFKLPFIKNKFFKNKSTFFNIRVFHVNTWYFNFFFNQKLKQICFVVQTILFFNKNILFVDYFNNYNYLPINNSIIFNRSFKFSKRLVKFFNIGLIFFFNVNKKNYPYKQYTQQNTINLSINTILNNNYIDLQYSSKLYLNYYVIYLIVLKYYIFFKK